jgi:hypothetical protein
MHNKKSVAIIIYKAVNFRNSNIFPNSIVQYFVMLSQLLSINFKGFNL